MSNRHPPFDSLAKLFSRAVHILPFEVELPWVYRVCISEGLFLRNWKIYAPSHSFVKSWPWSFVCARLSDSQRFLVGDLVDCLQIELASPAVCPNCRCDLTSRLMTIWRVCFCILSDSLADCQRSIVQFSRQTGSPGSTLTAFQLRCFRFRCFNFEVPTSMLELRISKLEAL